MNQAIKRGALTGIINAAWLITGFSILKALLPGSPQSILRTVTGLLGLVILFVGILYGIRKARAGRNGGAFTYADAVKTGIIISVIVAVIVSLGSVLYVTVINPGFTDDMVRETEQVLKQANASAAEISERTAAARKMFSISGQVMQALIVQALFGTIFSLIIGIFFRTRQK